MRNKFYLLRQCIPLVNGLFAHIDYQFWDFTATELDIIFLSKYSMRTEAPIIGMVRFLEDEIPDVIEDNFMIELSDRECCNPMLTDSQLTILGTIILKMFKPKWDRLKDLPFMEYNILYSYLDIYEEVQRDNNLTASKYNRLTDSMQDNASSSVSSSEFQGNTTNENSSDMSSTRTDEFEGAFSRTTDTTQTRTDNLKELNAERENNNSIVANNLTNGTLTTEERTSTRVDNLKEHIANQGSSIQSDSQLTANESNQHSVDDEISVHEDYTENTVGSNSTTSGVYGYNSDVAVPSDTGTGSNTGEKTSEKNSVTDGHESLTENKAVNSQLTDSARLDKNVSSKLNEGTQSNAEITTTNIAVSNGGSNQTFGDKRLTAETVNEGSQTIKEDGIISDTTTNTDNQNSSSSISSEGTLNNTNTSATMINSTDKSAMLSKMEDNKVVSEALDRAKKTIHKGNLGDVAPQDLIKKEIDLWRWNFINEVMEDIKSFISLAVYR